MWKGEFFLLLCLTFLNKFPYYDSYSFETISVLYFVLHFQSNFFFNFNDKAIIVLDT